MVLVSIDIVDQPDFVTAGPLTVKINKGADNVNTNGMNDKKLLFDFNNMKLLSYENNGEFNPPISLNTSDCYKITNFNHHVSTTVHLKNDINDISITLGIFKTIYIDGSDLGAGFQTTQCGIICITVIKHPNASGPDMGPLTIRVNDGPDLLESNSATDKVLVFLISSVPFLLTAPSVASDPTTFSEFSFPFLLEDLTQYKIVNESNATIYLRRYRSSSLRPLSGDNLYVQLNCDQTKYYCVDIEGITGLPDVFTDEPCCLHPGSKVETISGLVPIKNIKAGDKVKDIEGKFIDVVYNIKFSPTDKFVCIKKNSFGQHMPFEDLKATEGHPLIYLGKEITFGQLLETANQLGSGSLGQLVNDNNIVRETLEDTFVYTLCTSERTCVMTNGLPVYTWGQNDWETTLAKEKVWTRQ